MRKAMYEVEIQRTNTTPKQFFTYCKKQLEKKNINLADWCESFEYWNNPLRESEIDDYHKDWDEPLHEICKMKPLDWQMFLQGAYNFIMEFQFDDEQKGYGYLYIVEFER